MYEYGENNDKEENKMADKHLEIDKENSSVNDI
jgi:hypothetical protein